MDHFFIVVATTMTIEHNKEPFSQSNLFMLTALKCTLSLNA